jgi:hypothetical protein
MEFVNSFNTYNQKEDSGIYTQNNQHDDNCYFENRLTEPKEPLYIHDINDNSINIRTNVYNENGIEVNDNYSPKYTKPSKTTNISPSLTPINKPITSHYKMLIQDVNEVNKSSLINISDSYNIKNNEVNFNYDDFSEKNTIEGDYVLAKNVEQTKLLSVTNNQTYKNPEFWKSQVPEIITNEYLVRDIPEIFYDKNSKIERYALPKNNQIMNSNFYKGGETRYNVSQPKVSQNYKTNFTKKGEKIVHEGNKKRNVLKYQYNTVGNNTRVNDYNYNKSDNYSIPDEQGMFVYYDDNKDVLYSDEFGVVMNKEEIVDPNGNKYNMFMRSGNRKGENDDFNFYKDSMNIGDVSNYERNIMLNRNNNMLASTNYTMRYD